MTKYINGTPSDLYGIDTRYELDFIRSAQAYLHGNGVDVYDITVSGNVLKDGEGRYWLIDADNAARNYHNRTGSEGSEVIWRLYLDKYSIAPKDGWFP